MDEKVQRPLSEEIEKLRMKYSFLKFLLGTFAVSLLSVVINWQIQEKRLEFEIQTKESEYIAQFLKYGLDKELENRRDFAEYFVRLSPSEDSRGRWQNYRAFVTDLLAKANEAEKLIAEKDQELTIATANVSAAQVEAEDARAEARRLASIVNRTEEERIALENLRKESERSSAEAENFRKEVEALRSQVVIQRKELASLRSNPLDLEVNLPITADNIAVKSKTTEKYWDWTVFIQGPEDVLDQIKYVEYTLHPTFPNPVRIVSERGLHPYAFPLRTSGWGTFTIKIKVFLKDGRFQVLSHLLSFAES